MKQVREGLKPVYPKWVLNYISSIRPFNQVVIADAQHGEDSMAELRSLHRQVAEVAPGSTGRCGSCCCHR